MAQTKVKLVSSGVITVGHLHTNHGITTDHVGEGSLLYYSDSRVANYLTANDYVTQASIPTVSQFLTSLNLTGSTLSYIDEDNATTNIDLSSLGYLTSFTETDPIYTASSWYTTTNNSSNWDTAFGWGNHASQGYATETYVSTAVAGLVDAAPTTLDTLNELAAALGDDPNFATTVSTSIGTKWTQDNTKISNWDTAYSWGNHAGAGYLTSFTETDPTVPSHVKAITTTKISNWDTAFGWGNHASAGYQATSTAITTSNIGNQSVSNAATANGANGNFYVDDNYGNTVVGLYSAVRYQGVFAMGDAYKLPANGTTTGNLYGIAWSHPNAGGIAGNLAAYGMLILENGVFKGAWGGGSLRTPGDIRGTIYYDYDNTGYYLDPAGQSRLGNIERLAHNTGFLVGSYNTAGANSYRTNPIYSIGNSYKPDVSTLNNFYGIGYAHPNASFISLTGASGWGMYVAADGDARVYLDGSSGTVSATGDVIAYASDGRLKTNVKGIDNALEKVKSIRGVSYDWVDNIKDEYDFHPSKMHEVGVIAQEIQKVLPEVVHTAPFNSVYTQKTGWSKIQKQLERKLNRPVPKKEAKLEYEKLSLEERESLQEDHNFLTVNYERIVPLLIEAIKEQQQQIDELKSLLNK